MCACVWHQHQGFLLVSPGKAQIRLSDLTVLSDCSVDQKLVLGSAGVASSSILGFSHILIHVPTDTDIIMLEKESFFSALKLYTAGYRANPV